MVDGTLRFDTKISEAGFTAGIKNINRSVAGMQSAMLKLGTVIAGAFSVKVISDFAKECKQLWNIQLEAETKLEAVLRQRMNATDEAIQSIKDYASAQQAIGVVGDEVQLAGIQQMSTFLENTESIKKLLPAMNNLIVQQNGLNATTESAVNVGNLMGKAMQGQTSALTRVGITFSEAEEQAVKYGNELERAAALAKIITNNVGEMNVAFAKTNSGRLTQLSNTVGDIKEQFGSAVVQIEVLFLPVLQKVADMLGNIATFAQRVSQAIADVFNSSNSATKVVSGIAGSIDKASDSYSDMADSAEQVENATKESLAKFDEINTLSSQTQTIQADAELDKADLSVIPSSAVIDIEANTDPLVDAIKRIKAKLDELSKPIKLAWDMHGSELIANAQSMVANIKDLVLSISDSFEKVWLNGTGERFVSNLIVLFSDVLGIIGDIANAFTNAWNDNGTGEALIQSYFDRWNALLELIHVIASDVRDVWNDGTGEEIFKNIFEILTNINETVANLREQFSLAWQENEVGKRIIKSVFNLFNIILNTINNITKATKEWAKKLDFSPILESIAGLLKSLEPFTQNIGEGLEWFYKNVLLNLASWTIEDVIPAFLNLLAGAIDVLTAVIEVFKPFAKWLWDKFLEPVAKWTGGVIVSVINGIAKALTGVSDWIKKHKKLVQDMAIVFVSLGTALKIASIIQGLITAFTTLGGVMGVVTAIETGLTTVTTALGGVIAFLTSPITLVCLAIAGLIAIVIILWENIQETMYNFFDMWVSGWESIKEFTSNLWDTIVGIFATAWESIKAAWKNAASWFTDVWNGIAAVFSTVATWFEGIFATAWESIKTAWENVVSWFADVWNGIAAVFSAVATWFKGVFETAWSNIKKAWKNVVSWFADVWNGIAAVFSVVATWFKGVFETAWNNIKKAWNTVSKWFSDVWNSIKTAFSNADEWFRNKFQSAYDSIKAVFSAVGDWFSDRFEDIKTAFSDVADWFGSIFQTAWSNITVIFIAIGSWFADRWNDITNAFGSAAEWFGNIFQSAWNGLTNIFIRIGNWFSERWNDITNAFSGVADWFSSKFQEAYNGITDIFSGLAYFFYNLWDDISDGAKNGINWIIDVINGLLNSVENAVNFIIDCINSISFDIPDFVPGIGGTHVGFDIPWANIPNIPYLATGTVVPASYGEFLAVLGDNKRETEVVSPLSTIRQAVSEAMAQQNTAPREVIVNVSMFPNERAFARYIIKANGTVKARGGKM